MTIAKLLVLVCLAFAWCGCASSVCAPDAYVADSSTPGEDRSETPDVHACRWEQQQLWHRECCASAECVAHGDPGTPETDCVAPPASARTTCQQRCGPSGDCPSGLTCAEDGYCWFYCRPQLQDCPGSLECVPHGTYTAGPIFVCQGARL